jgi:hypothetical protein
MKETQIARKRWRDIVGHIDGADHAAIAEIVGISDTRGLVMTITGPVLGINKGNKMVN